MQPTFCQSCGSDMAHMNPGTNADGTPSTDYCEHCYPAGAFANPNETLQEMIDSCAPFWVAYHIAENLDQAKTMLAAHLPTLKRWRQA